MNDVQHFKEIISNYFMALPAVKLHYKLRGNETFNARFPQASIEGVLIHLWAFGAWVVNSLFEAFKIDVDERIRQLKPHTLQWYVNRAKCYQHGVSLPTSLSGQVSGDTYDKINDAKQIIKYAVAQEVTITRDGQDVGSVVAMKVAKYTNPNNPSPIKLTDEELQGLKYYFSQIKDAGVPISIVSNDPDTMNANISIHYNPIILEPSSDNTALIDDNGNDVIKDAILATIEGLPFNGVLKKSDLIDAIKAIAGIEVVDVTAMAVRPAIDGAEYKSVTGFCVPTSGYFAITQLILTLKPYSDGN